MVYLGSLFRRPIFKEYAYYCSDKHLQTTPNILEYKKNESSIMKVNFPIDVPSDCPFGVLNIPFGIFSTASGSGLGVSALQATCRRAFD